MGPRIGFFLTSKKLKEVPRTLQQLRGFAVEATRSQNLFSPEDTKFLQWLDSQHPAERDDLQISDFVVSGHSLHSWLTLLGQAERCYWQDGTPVRCHSEPAFIIPRIFSSSSKSVHGYEASQDGGRKLPALGFVVQTPDGKQVLLNEARVVYPKDPEAFNEPAFVFVNGIFYPLSIVPPKSILFPFLEGGSLPLSTRRRTVLLRPLLKRFPRLAEDVVGLVRYHPVRLSFTFSLHPNDWVCVRLFANSRHAALKWEFTQEGWVVSHSMTEPHRSSEVVTPPENELVVMDGAPVVPENGSEKLHPANGAIQEGIEDLPEPSEAEVSQSWLESWGLQSSEEAEMESQEGWWTYLNSERIEILLEQWASRPQSAEYWANPSFRTLVSPTKRSPLRLKIQSSGMDWFSVSADLASFVTRLTSEDLEKICGSGDTYVKLSSGSWIGRSDAEKLQKTLDVMADLGLDPSTNEPQRLALTQLAGTPSLLQQLSGTLSVEEDEETAKAIQDLKTKLATFKGLPDVAMPQRLRATMRNYQIEGVKFLVYVASLKLGAILADDMGLGKTLQALAWMEHLRDLEGPAPCLVVCPASVVYNWQREAEKFVPGSSTLLLTSGEARHSLRKEIPRSDLVITNYALLRRDLEELKRFNLDVQNRVSALQARFAALGDTWQDQEHAKFSDEFKNTIKALKKFVEVSNQHTPYLLRKAQRIEDYLKQR
jgi:hypothetical protein